MEEKSKNKSRVRTIKLYCPPLSKISQIITWEDQKLDLGTIARTFGLEPSTMKLNGHFISRGVDLIASSVTWRSLLSFFSSRGLSTGFDGSGALIVDGKLSKSVTKRVFDPTEVENGVSFTTLHKEGGEISKNPQRVDISSIKSKKLKESNKEREQDILTGLKRKHWLETISPLKKLRANIRCSNQIPKATEEREEPRFSGNEGKENGRLGSKLPCGYLLSENMKRMRDGEVLVAVSCKRTR